MYARRSTTTHRSKNQLKLEVLEDRSMMSAVPAYSSLPTAPKTLYLDFDGDFQAVWHRTDVGQTYNNIASSEFNTDGKAGFSASELGDIAKIWANVAEDYAPFNVNVTTVEPAAAAFTTNQAMRVVIAGNTSAQLFDPHFIAPGVFTLYDNVSGNRFITDDNGRTLKDTSGYSAIGSFTSSEPNVVFVFAAYTNTWSSTDSEGHARDYDQLIANTASHEAGHTFGLVHHQGVDAFGNASEYDVGTFDTTPIMGSNTSSDRTIWSKNSTQDCVQILTNVLGAWLDDVGDSWSAAANLPMYSPIIHTIFNTASGSATGVISTLSDSDWYHVSAINANYHFEVDPVALGNLDAKLDVYTFVYIPFLHTSVLSLVAESDPTIPSNQPFVGESASLSLSLAAGDYYVVVRSHGNYGDLGQYTLYASRSTTPAVLTTQYAQVQETVPVGPGPVEATNVSAVRLAAAGVGDVAPVTTTAATASALALATPTKVAVKSTNLKLMATDLALAAWN